MYRMALLGTLMASTLFAACSDDAVEAGPGPTSGATTGGTGGAGGSGADGGGGATGGGVSTSAGGNASAGGAGSGGSPMGPPGSLEFYVNEPRNDDDYAQLVDLPPTFGEGPFTFELWVKLDASLPVGATSGSEHQNWTIEDPMPGGGSWWYPGNFLLDGHDNGGNGYGTFDLQIYGSGRVRWLFNDSFDLWGVQAYPAADAPSLLDDAWHSIATVRRHPSPSEATLELWVDGTLIDSQTTAPINMRQWWDDWSTFPATEPGWFFGAEKISATGGGYWDDFKGQIGELRFWDIARPASDLMQPNVAVTGTESGLVGWYRLDEGTGTVANDSLQNGGSITLYPAGESIWNSDGPG